MNVNIQTAGYAGADIDFDSDVDDDSRNCLLCEYWYYRTGDIYTLAALKLVQLRHQPQQEPAHLRSADRPRRLGRQRRSHRHRR